MGFRAYRAPTFNFLQGRAGSGVRVLQRRCACGSRAESEGTCSECAEKEGMLQRKSLSGRALEAPAIVDDVLRAPGQPLDSESRSFMESRFGYDFSGVRIHSDEQAHRSAEATAAEAYTVGRDIVFASGRYSPHTAAGKELLAHELTHVVQQQSAAPTSGAITMGGIDEHEVNADTTAAAVISGNVRNATIGTANVGLQRAPAGPKPTSDTETPCLEEVVGEDIPSLLQAGAVTVIEFGAEWCGPCEQLKAGLRIICKELGDKPPPVPVRFYSIDIEAPGNEEASRPFLAGGEGIPHLYFYVGGAEKAHYNQAPDFEVLQHLVAEHIEYATTSGAARGAKKGLGWGTLAGGLAGIGGAIAIGAKSGLEGNALMGGILGSIVGGAALGLGLGAGIGAIAGHFSDDRMSGPKEQKRKKLQTKSRNETNPDPEEREADLWASQVTSTGNGRALDPPTRGSMENQFGRDFSHVRVHRDAPLEAIAPGLDAYAVTRGSNIYLAPGADAPNPSFDRHLLGHELAHVVQNESSGPAASAANLEAEADQVAVNIAAGRRVNVAQSSNEPVLAISGRAKKTLKSMAAFTAIGGAAGAGIGLIAASQMAGTPYGAGAAIGGLIGGGLGLLSGFFYGFFARRTEPVEAPEAEVAIRERFGAYLPGGRGPLNNALVKPVDRPDLCMYYRCRFGPETVCPGGLQGWTDQGREPPNQIERAEDEPVCGDGKQLEHASHERPVIYFDKQRRHAGTVVHEGLHAYGHESFAGQLRNGVNEGTTEYFTRQILSDLNIAEPEATYEDELAEVTRMVPIVGEETLKRAYFLGDMDALHTAANSQLGPCALIEWAIAVQTLNFGRNRPREIVEGRNVNYCRNDELSSATPVAAPPAEGTPA